MRALTNIPPVTVIDTADGDAVSILRQSGIDNKITPAGMGKARELADGPGDVLVLLDCPAPNYDYNVSFQQFLDECATLKAVDDMIKFATSGTRDISTISVFDANSFIPQSWTGR